MRVPLTVGTSNPPRGCEVCAAATGEDYPAHGQTYRSFVALVKVGIAVVAIIVIPMACFLT